MSKSVSKISACAIIISYQPEPAVLLSLLQQISAQADFILIDNASTNVQEFLPQAQALPRCRQVQVLERNVGLAAAMNIGLAWVRDAGYGYALLFDQDSQVPATFFADMHAAYIEADRLCDHRVAAVGPRIVSPVNNRAMPFKLFSRWFRRSDLRVSGTQRLYRADFLISSGCMLSLAALEQIGPMRESYFIDNVDLEWCFRARSQGYQLVGTDMTVLHHSIGVASDNPLVKRGWVVSHSPLRSYYSTRNRFALYREPYAPLGWKLRDFPRFVLKTLWLLLCSPQRVEYWREIRRGLADVGSVA